MTLVNINIQADAMIESLAGKEEKLSAAILERMDILGIRLLERVQGKLSGEVLERRTGALLGDVDIWAANFVGQVCGVSVGIPDEAPSWLVGMTHEYGGTRWYDIYPYEAIYQAAGLTGKGRISPHSAEDSIARAEGQLPHTLRWEGPDGVVFAMHVWHPPAKERSYLRSSLAEMEEEAVGELHGVLEEVMAL